MKWILLSTLAFAGGDVVGQSGLDEVALINKTLQPIHAAANGDALEEELQAQINTLHQAWISIEPDPEERLTHGAVLRQSRPLRQQLENTLLDVLEAGDVDGVVGGLSKPLAKLYNERRKALGKQLENYPLTPQAREAYLVSAAYCDEATTAAKKKRHGKALREAFACARELDKVLHEAYPSSR